MQTTQLAELLKEIGVGAFEHPVNHNKDEWVIYRTALAGALLRLCAVELRSSRPAMRRRVPGRRRGVPERRMMGSFGAARAERRGPSVPPRRTVGDRRS